ncbi:MAG: BatD family protein [Cellvibrionaceae bacterium]|nr:BatD family protein [Cellvibrionaceae bacterium]
MQRLLFCLIWVFCQQSLALSLSASVDRTTIAENESLNLVITLDSNSSDQIDTRQLSHQFEIITQQRSARQSIINGRISASTQWSYSLLPKDVGELVIPSFEYRGAYSDAIAITVNKGNTQQADLNSDVFLQLSVDKNRVYVQQQLLITLRLYYKINLSNYEADTLALDNALLTPLKEHSFSTQVRGEQYQVLELRYAVNPQASGQLQIPAQRWRLQKATGTLFGNRFNNQYIIVNSDAVTITVDPTPAHYQGEHWLPSSRVTLEGQWQDSIIQARVGEPINYRLALSAEGLHASQLPEISLPTSDHLSLYQDPSTSDNTQSERGITGKRAHNFALIPQRAGTWVVPEITLSWWNVDSEQEETIRLPPQTLVVTPSALNHNERPLPDKPDAATTTVNTATPQQTNIIVWQLSATILALLCIGMGAFIYTNRHRRQAATETAAAIDRKPSTKYWLKQIQKAIDTADNKALYTALIHWGQHSSDNPQLNSLSQLGDQFPQLAEDIHKLNQHTYGKPLADEQSPEHWQPQAFIDAIKNLPNTKHTQHKNTLLPLYDVNR